MNDALQRKLDTLPDGPGVYLWKDAGGGLLYVGKAANLRTRVRSYFGGDGAGLPFSRLLIERIADVETIVVPDEAQSLLLENNLIKEYQPRFNVRLKDDKSYPSIAVTVGEPFPRVLVTRRRNIRGARYFGPYTDVGEMRRTLSLIRRMFTVRSCHDDLPAVERDRPCLDYYIGRCRAPCTHRQEVAEYRAMIDEVVAFLDGRTVDLKARIRALMLAAAERQDFERAGDFRDALKWLDRLEEPVAVEAIGSGDADVVGLVRDGDDAVAVLFRVRDGRVIGREHRFLEATEGIDDAEVLHAYLMQWYLPADDKARRLVLAFAPSELEPLAELLGGPRITIPQRGVAARWIALAEQNGRHLLESLRLETFETAERADDPTYALGRELGLAAVPRRFICIDISTNQGRDTVGSLVTFEAGRPRKSEYRKFRIKGIATQDDYAAIHEVVTRYFQRRLAEHASLPDLIIIDGGRGQLNIAGEALGGLGLRDIPIIALAKREEEIFRPGLAEPLRLPRRSPALRLLQRARDEAHRFGVAYNRKRRTQRTITSALLEIPGIGNTRRRELLHAFGSLTGVRSASIADVAALPGFSHALATRIHAYLTAH